MGTQITITVKCRRCGIEVYDTLTWKGVVRASLSGTVGNFHTRLKVDQYWKEVRDDHFLCESCASRFDRITELHRAEVDAFYRKEEDII